MELNEVINDIDMTTSTVLVVVGVIGFVVKAVAYTMVQTGRLDGNSLAYTLCNIVAAALVLVSMFDQFNLSALLSQVMWITVGGVGVCRHVGVFARREPQSSHHRSVAGKAVA